jgi:hypothetical protein
MEDFPRPASIDQPYQTPARYVFDVFVDSTPVLERHAIPAMAAMSPFYAWTMVHRRTWGRSRSLVLHWNTEQGSYELCQN